LDHRYVVGVRSYVILGLICLLLFGGCSVGAFLAEQYWPILIFGTFVVAGLYLIASAGSYEITSSRILHRNFFGQFEMRWNDVQEVELGTQGAIVLHGKDKRFVLAPVSAWSGADKSRAAETLSTRLDVAGIRGYSSNSADYKVHRNVRV